MILTMAKGTIEINYDATTIMKHGYPRIRKTGIVSPNGESTPFVFNGELYRLELEDRSRGTDASAPVCALIRHRETGRVLSRLAQNCYYQSFYQEDGVAYVIGTKSEFPRLSGHSYLIFESRDLVNWTERELISRPGWQFYNSSLTKGPDGYVLCMEAGYPAEPVGDHPFTVFFATSPDMVNWTFMNDDLGFSKDRYMGGPWLKYSEGWYYLISVTALPCAHYTNYIYRTKDFVTWYVGLYNPILMPSDEDKNLSLYAYDLTPEMIEEIRTGFNINNSDIDMCDWNGKTIINYLCGNQLGFYYMCEAEYDGTVAELLASYFE